MSVAAVRRVVSRLEPPQPLTDAELVAAIAPGCAGREAAFAELVARFGPMVLGVCRRVLADAHDAEDSFQAVFLVLARKAKTIHPPGAVGGWLHGVAVRTARKAKTAAARRRRREMIATAQANPDLEVGGGLQQAELRAVIDAELAALPEMQRAALVLCDLHGMTRAEAAAELGRPEGTVAAWLARGRKALAARLSRRGIALPAAGLLSVAAPAAVSAELASAAVAHFLGRAAPSGVIALAEGVMRGFTSAKLATLVVAFGALLAVVATATAWHNGDEPKPGEGTAPIAAPVPQPEPDVNASLDHVGYVYSVSYASDGRKFLSVGNGTAAVWDSATLKKLFTVDAEFAAFSGDGKSLLVLVKDEFRTHDSATGKQLGKKARQMPKAASPGRTAAFARESWMWVEFDGVRHHLRTEIADELYDLADQFDRALTGGLRNVNYGRGGAFSSDGKRFAGIHRVLRDAEGGPQGSQGVLSVWDQTNGTRIGTIVRDANHPVRSFAWSPDGKEIAVGYGDGVRVYDAATLKEARVLDPPGRWGDPRPHTTALAWSADGKTLAAAITTEVPKRVEHDDGRITIEVDAIRISVRLLDARSGKELRRVEGFPDNLPVVSLAFALDGKQLLCGAGFFPGDGPAVNVPQPAKDAKGLRVIPLGAPAKPDENPGPVAWKETKVLGLPGWLGGSASYSPDGKTLFIGGTSGFVRAYDTATWKQLWEHQEPTNFAGVAAAPDGKSLAVTFKDADRRWGVRLLNAATKKLEHTLDEGGVPGVVGGPEPFAVGFFPDVLLPGLGRVPPPNSRKLIFGTASGYVVKTWADPEKASTIRSSTVAAGKQPADTFAVPLAVDPTGNRVVVTGPIDKDTGTNVLWAWSAGSGDANKLLEGHKARVISAAWSKNGKVIVTGDADGVVITWDAATFKEKSRLELGGRVAAVAVTDDGFGIAAGVVRGAPRNCTGDVFIWPAALPPKKPEPLSSQVTGSPFIGVASLAFSPDGKQLASCFANMTLLTRSGILVGTVRVFAVAPVPLPEPKKPASAKGVTHAEYTRDGKMYLAVAGGKATVYDAATGKQLYSVAGEAARLTADSKALVVMGEKQITYHDATSGRVTVSYDRPTLKWEWHKVAFAPDGKQFVADFGAHAGVYDVATGKEAVKLDKRHEMLGYITPTGKQIVFSPDGKKVALVGVLLIEDGRAGAAVWDTATGKRLNTFPGDPKDELRTVVFSPDAASVAVGFVDRVEVWVIEGDAKKNPVRKFPTKEPVTALAYSKDGKQLAVGLQARSYDRWWADVRQAYKGKVLVLDATTGEWLRTYDGFQRDSVLVDGDKVKEPTPEVIRGHDGFWVDPLVTAVAFSPDGKALVAGTGVPPVGKIPAGINKGGEVKRFDRTAPPPPPPDPPPGPDLPERREKWTDAAVLTDHGRLVIGVAVAPDGKSFAAATEGGVTCWDAATRKVLWKSKPAEGPAFALAYSPDGKHLCWAGLIDIMRLDAKTGKPDPWPNKKGTLLGMVNALAYSPDGSRLAASNGYKTMVLSPMEKAGARSTWGQRDEPPPTRQGGVAWSKDGKQLAEFRPEKHGGIYEVVLWALDREKDDITSLKGHTALVTCIAWSSDGKLIASGDEGGTVVAWDAESGKELWRKRLGEGAGRVHSLAMSPEDNAVAVAAWLGARKSPERVLLLAAKDGAEIQHLVGRSDLPVSSLAWAPDGKFLVTGCGAAGRAIKQSDPAVGEVVVWERK